MPKMRHPNSRLTVTPDPDQVANYRSQGWRETPEPKRKRAPHPADPATNTGDES